MIRIFYGVPGAGKSYNALRDMVEELLYGSRLIVTNCAVDIGKLNAYLQRKYPGVDYGDINQRIRIISEEETRTFYAFRHVADAPLRVPSKAESLRGIHVDYSGVPAVCYYIEEAHIAFDARNWDQTGPELTFYASQHRKLSDESVFITQHPDMLEKRLRMLAQRFYSHVNNALRRAFTFFQMPAYFSCNVYSRPPTGGPGDPPAEEKRVFKLDKELADCYDTSAGIGIAGRKMPEKARKKGASVFWLLVPLACVLVALHYAPLWTGKFFSSTVIPKDKPADSAAHGAAAGGSPSPTGGPPKASREDKTAVVDPGPPARVRSITQSKDDALVVMTDGRVFTRGTGLIAITRDWVFLRDGSRFQVPRGTVVPPSSAVGTRDQNSSKKVLTTHESRDSVVVHEQYK